MDDDELYDHLDLSEDVVYGTLDDHEHTEMEDDDTSVSTSNPTLTAASTDKRKKSSDASNPDIGSPKSRPSIVAATNTAALTKSTLIFVIIHHY